jgi:hypothetical protein
MLTPREPANLMVDIVETLNSLLSAFYSASLEDILVEVPIVTYDSVNETVTTEVLAYARIVQGTLLQ